MERLKRIPFLRLLLPLLVGIIIQYYFFIHKWSFLPLLIGLGIMLLSYFIPRPQRFRLRWVFGLGINLTLFSIGTLSTVIRQDLSSITFPEVNQSYKALITDIPQEKPSSVVLNARLEGSNKNIICYIPKDSLSNKLKVGDQIYFFSKIERFSNIKSQGRFSYGSYMYNKGYVGYTFVRTDRWELIQNEKHTSFMSESGKCRQSIINFYQSLDLDNNELALLSALTLGYKSLLSDDLLESFRTTGVAHILAISGMHIGLIYVVIISLLNFIPNRSKNRWLKPLLVILILWLYLFLIGFPPSAVRACIMLSMFCTAQIKGLKTYSLNSLCAAAFIMLVWNPFWLFDLGFQLSFAAVASMLIFIPMIKKPQYIRNKYINYFWNMLMVSLAAQIGTLPLCLYYFGFFPCYFFITNLLVIPLISLIIYDAIIILILGGFNYLFANQLISLIQIPICIYKYTVQILTYIIHFFERLPIATLQNIRISFTSTLLLWGIIICGIFFLKKVQARHLIFSLSCLLLFLLIKMVERMEDKNSLRAFYNKEHSDISYNVGYQRTDLAEISSNNLLTLNNKRYLLVTEDKWKEQSSEYKYDIDYLHIVKDNQISLYSLNQKLNIKNVILDGSLSAKSLKRFVSECEKLRIPYYDISENGDLRIFF